MQHLRRELGLHKLQNSSKLKIGVCISPQDSSTEQIDKKEIVHSKPSKREMEQMNQKIPQGLALKKIIAQKQKCPQARKDLRSTPTTFFLSRMLVSYSPLKSRQFYKKQLNSEKHQENFVLNRLTQYKETWTQRVNLNEQTLRQGVYAITTDERKHFCQEMLLFWLRQENRVHNANYSIYSAPTNHCEV